MKSLLWILPIVLVGCATGTRTNVPDGECTSVSQVEIFQALNDGALANECYFNWDKLTTECSAFNQTVFIKNAKEVEYYDGMKLELKNNQCFKRKGVYKYESKDNRARTVPTLIIDNK
jgi:hypothetical protein